MEAVFARFGTEDASVPGLWWVEVANALQAGLRRKRISAAQRSAYLASLRDLPIRTDENTAAYAWGRTLSLSDVHGLTVYDAAYLELAIRLRLPLATLDHELRVAAAAENVVLLGT